MSYSVLSQPMMQRVGSRIPAYGLVAIASMMPMMAMAGDNGIRLMRDCDEDECVAKMYPGSEIPNLSADANGIKTYYSVPTISTREKQRKVKRLTLNAYASSDEVDNAVDLEIVTCSNIQMVMRYPPNENGKRPPSPDFRFVQNNFAPQLIGRTGDFMFTNHLKAYHLNLNFKKNWDKPKGTKRQVINHLAKSHYVFFDFRVLDADNQITLYNFINTELSKSEKARIIIRR